MWEADAITPTALRSREAQSVSRSQDGGSSVAPRPIGSGGQRLFLPGSTSRSDSPAVTTSASLLTGRRSRPARFQLLH